MLAEIGFYHLTRMPLEQALPRLLGRVLAQQGRALVLLRRAGAAGGAGRRAVAQRPTRTGCRMARRGSRASDRRSSRSG